MNQYELAVLRILLKSPAPVSKSKVVNGFPDDSTDFVLSAISDLKQANFVVSRQSSGDETLELARKRKRDVLALIRSKEPEDATSNSSNTGSGGGRGKGMTWITTTLMIVGALTSVFVAYAMGVNDRIAASPQPAAYQDATFGIVGRSDGDSGVMAKPATWHIKLHDANGGPAPGEFVMMYAMPTKVVKWESGEKVPVDAFTHKLVE
jgi:hypothetical protein